MVHSIITFPCILFQVPCCDELCTKECLGYTISCFHNSHDEGGSFNIIVLSQKCHPNKIIATIHEFLRNTYEKVIAPSHFRRVFSEAKKSVEKDLIFNTKTELDISRQFWRGVQKGFLLGRLWLTPSCAMLSFLLIQLRLLTITPPHAAALDVLWSMNAVA